MIVLMTIDVTGRRRGSRLARVRGSFRTTP